MTDPSRRLFLTRAAGCTVAVSFIGTAFASDLPKVDVSDTNAVALKYTPDASTVDASVRGGERMCSACNFYSDGADVEWGPCVLFAGKAVAGKGWCTAWVARAA